MKPFRGRLPPGAAFRNANGIWFAVSQPDAQKNQASMVTIYVSTDKFPIAEFAARTWKNGDNLLLEAEQQVDAFMDHGENSLTKVGFSHNLAFVNDCEGRHRA
jgi:hypothetical protein